ncbi:phospholipid N-methyltransferase [Tenacibaculum adriaticum]|uniref:Phospholipid N-methyltransferase n=1 Tax=Tenacibaculum adriaticum TaxID=413713 RepID=A0A5S5DYW3_9FLAO|nr:methyltransferase domain-containing protein [Tenacibaculum adriaticum]TYP99769.1 phospholipid N-methyltransferase [Tenacibaculum adriaticum]
MNKKFNFFKEAVKNYKTSGTIVPSSRFLADKLLKFIDFSDANVIVELGPGNGAVTKYILKKIKPQTTLVCFEINDAFYRELLKIKHPQLKIVKASAEHLNEELQKLGFLKADYIISSLPLAILPQKLSKKILKESFKVLKKDGLYMQFQYSLSYYKKLKNVFGNSISLSFEPLNFPPAFIYKCAKK